MTSVPLSPFLESHADNYVGTLDRAQSLMFASLLIKAGATAVMAANPIEERADTVHIIIKESAAVTVAVLCIAANFTPDHMIPLGKYKDTEHNLVEVWWD
jgi:hypothetical protein